MARAGSQLCSAGEPVALFFTALVTFTLLPHLFSCFLPTAQHDDFLFRAAFLPHVKNSTNENELIDLLICVCVCVCVCQNLFVFFYL